MITLNGVTLLLEDEDGECQKYVDRFCSYDDLRIFSEPVALVDRRVNPRTCGPGRTPLPLPNWSAPPRPKVNTLWWPTGASRWAIGYFLATAEILDKAGIAPSPGLLVPTISPATLVIHDDGSGAQSSGLLVPATSGGSLTAKVYLLPQRAIASIYSSPSPLYLLPLVDVRYFWQFMNSGDLDATDDDYSWDNLFTALGTALGVTVNNDDFDADYLQPDKTEWTRRYENAAVLLDAAAACVGQRIVVDPDGSVYSLGFDSSATAFDGSLEENLLTSISGDYYKDFDVLNAIAPASVRVAFPLDSSDTADYFKEDTAITDADLGELSTPATVASTAKVFFNSAIHTAANEATLITLAQKIASDYYKGLAYRYDLTFSGIPSWDQGGFDDWIWYHAGRMNGSDREGMTRVASMPFNFGVQNLLHRGDDAQPCGSATGIPFRNDSGATVPPYGLVIVTSTTVLDGDGNPIKKNGKYVRAAVKPSSSYSREILVNGPDEVANGDMGTAQTGPDVTFAFDSTSPSPALGACYGAKTDQFTASYGWPGNLFYIKTVDADNLWAAGRFATTEALTCHITGDISAMSSNTPGSGTATIYYFNGTSFASTGMTLTVYNLSTSIVTAGSGAYVGVRWDRGLPIVDIEDCPAS